MLFNKNNKAESQSITRAGFVCLVLLTTSSLSFAQAAPLEWTTQQDHINMQEQLGITALRPGPSGNTDAPNAANVDEAKANRYPVWPDLLTLDNGQKVESAKQWWQERRPQLVEAFEREVVGRIPANVPGVTWSITELATGTMAGKAVQGQHLTGTVDNSAYPQISVELDLTLVLPTDAQGPVPVMILFGGASLQQAIGNEERRRFGPPPSAEDLLKQEAHATEQLINAGWGFAYLNPGSIQADNGEGLTRGIIGLVNQGQARKPDDWGALRAWAWGAARTLDYLETNAQVDASKVGIEGVSRYGKAALVTLAFEPRFALGLIGSSGEGGVSPYRRDFGEMVENITGSGEYHWMAGNFLKYGTAESSFGSMDANDLPVDAHTLIALAAPRATFISYGIPEMGDALWLDQQGSYMASVAASKVFKLLGVAAVGSEQHYQSAIKPPVNQGFLTTRLAWRQHDGGHTDAPNWKYFIPWAERELGISSASPASAFPRTDINSHLAHQALLNKRFAGDIDLYFIGDSITRRWGALDYPELLSHWNQTFAGWNAANFAWGGDKTENILWRLGNGELDKIAPKMVVIQAGTNNVGSTAGGADKVEAISAGLGAIIDEVQAKQPQAQIVLTAIFPRSDATVVSEIQEINRSLAAIAEQENIYFLNINNKLADSKGLLLSEMGSDGLHLSAAGLEVWAQALSPIVSAVLGPKAAKDNAPPATGNPAAGF